jgi:DNA primase
MTPQAKIKYLNSPGEWSKGKGLYPYDYTAKMMDEFAEAQGFRAVMLVEGARDAACACIEGFPALGILGTQSWCDEKMSNVLDLDPDIIMECFDGDSAGNEAAARITPKLRKLVPVISANLSDAAAWLKKDKLDPGNAPEKVFKRMWQALLERRSATYPKPKG